MKEEKQIIKGVIGAILVAILFYYLSNYYIVRGGTPSIYSLIFILIGLIVGFTIGVGKTNLLSKEQRFFSLSWVKMAWVIFIWITTLFFSIILTDIIPTIGWIGQLSVFLLNVYGWIFFLLGGLITMVISPFIMVYNPSPFESELFVWGQFSINRLWDYFLVCLVLYIIRKLKNKKYENIFRN